MSGNPARTLAYDQQPAPQTLQNDHGILDPTISPQLGCSPCQAISSQEPGTNAQHHQDDRLGDGKRHDQNTNTPWQAGGASSTNEHINTSDSYVAASTLPQLELETPSTASPTPKDTSKRWLPVPSGISTSPDSPSSIFASFQGLALDIPSSGLSDEIGTNDLKFSARGSMLLDGRKVNGEHQLIAAKTMPAIKEPVQKEEKKAATGRKRAVTSIADRPQTRAMSTDEELLSEKVRLFYSLGSDSTTDVDAQSMAAKRMNLRPRDAVHGEGERESTITTSRATSTTDVSRLPPSPTISREDNELAGGAEDWQDVNNADVDRYGFIIPRSPTSTVDAVATTTASGQGLQRVATSLQLASDTPRRKHTVKRSPSLARSTKSEVAIGRTPSSASMPRPSSSKSVNLHRHHSASRALANRLPHNRERRVLDEAGDMLTLPRSSTTITMTRTMTDEAAAAHSPLSTPQSRRKENERQEKWRKMAQPVPINPGIVGGGMTFTFDTTSPKLIERAWKGIPDSWRATAWYSFLATSVAKHNKRHPHKPCLSDEDLISMFYEYQDHNSPDDVQIDIDVPRTISSHIMFRRRYRGGQRLLFRVLHAMSMHFADLGYVQGMAALAATLLAYYQEEKAFIMLVRLWELRGLEKLYKHGFGGLMEALDDFEKGWLGQGELKTKFDTLHIYPTAYGTRWYLTLFNYSIPFPAQLRVWDVFMLLGDNEFDEGEHDERPKTAHQTAENSTPATNTNDNTSITNEKMESEKANFGTTLDVLHATSAALIDGMRDILLESDFEDAMKNITSFVPIKDVDLFIRVAKVEWQMHMQRRKHQKGP